MIGTLFSFANCHSCCTHSLCDDSSFKKTSIKHDARMLSLMAPIEIRFKESMSKKAFRPNLRERISALDLVKLSLALACSECSFLWEPSVFELVSYNIVVYSFATYKRNGMSSREVEVHLTV